MQRPDYAHALNHLPECRETLSVRVSATTKVEFPLFPNADEELTGGCAWSGSGHGYGPVEVTKASLAGRFVSNGWKRRSLVIGLVASPLDYLNLCGGLGSLVCQGDEPVDRATVKVFSIHVGQVVGHRGWRLVQVYLYDERAEFRLYSGQHRGGAARLGYRLS